MTLPASPLFSALFSNICTRSCRPLKKQINYFGMVTSLAQIPTTLPMSPANAQGIDPNLTCQAVLMYTLICLLGKQGSFIFCCEKGRRVGDLIARGACNRESMVYILIFQNISVKIIDNYVKIFAKIKIILHYQSASSTKGYKWKVFLCFRSQ